MVPRIETVSSSQASWVRCAQCPDECTGYAEIEWKLIHLGVLKLAVLVGNLLLKVLDSLFILLLLTPASGVSNHVLATL